ncbi:MAG: hypothetical protein HC915_02260 [Anaerolineae bacterium]|nr:hypothetical protein [Anaerolineae bacterium]
MTAAGTYDIGRVLRASTEGFTCGLRSQELQYPAYGAFVQTMHLNGDGSLVVIGVITAIRIDDDPLVRQLIMANTMNEAALRDQRENRLVPVEIDVLSIGYMHNGHSIYNLPPRPPMSLDPVGLCNADTIEYFTEGLDFIRLILKARNVSTEDLLGAAIRGAAQSRATQHQRAFLVAAGRRLAGC